MGRLLRNIALFSLPFVGLLTWLLIATPEPAYRYLMVQKDCRTGSWIYRRLYQSSAPIDVAFIGTSKTMCDVDDGLIETKVRERYDRALHIANLGVCRIGENFHYLVARDLLDRKKPRHIIYEVSTELPTVSHFDFPDVATAGDVLGAPMLLNVDYVGDVTNLAWNRLVYHREHLLGIEHPFHDFLEDSLHSFMVVPTDRVADSTEMARIKRRRQKSMTANLPSGWAGMLYGLKVRLPKHYLLSLHDLCQARGVTLTFLYLPSYGVAAPQPQEMTFLEGLGQVWIAPDSVMGDPKVHFDDSHLNMVGAQRLSDWLSEKVADLEGQ
jgi:hypothetical protein